MGLGGVADGARDGGGSGRCAEEVGGVLSGEFFSFSFLSVWLLALFLPAACPVRPASLTRWIGRCKCQDLGGCRPVSLRLYLLFKFGTLGKGWTEAQCCVSSCPVREYGTELCYGEGGGSAVGAFPCGEPVGKGGETPAAREEGKVMGTKGDCYNIEWVSIC